MWTIVKRNRQGRVIYCVGLFQSRAMAQAHAAKLAARPYSIVKFHTV